MQQFWVIRIIPPYLPMTEGRRRWRCCWKTRSTIQFKDLQEGITLNEEVDEVTGLSRLVVAEAADEKRQPAIVIKGAKGNKRYLMPSRAHL